MTADSLCVQTHVDTNDAKCYEEIMDSALLSYKACNNDRKKEVLYIAEHSETGRAEPIFNWGGEVAPRM